MTLWFIIPPPQKRLGGLDTALRGLTRALEAQGCVVEANPPLSGKPDAIHLHGLWETAYSPYVRYARQHGVPLVISPHGMLEPWAFRLKGWKKKPFFQLVEKRRFRQAAGILATSALEQGNLERLLPGLEVTCLSLGGEPVPPADRGDARMRLGLAPGEKVLLYLSRLDRKKGLDLLLEALASPACAGLRDRARLCVVGDGDAAFEGELRAFCQARAADLPPVQFVGPVWGAEKFDWFHAADLFCLPTHSENFGLAVLEALQCGTPVLTTCHTPWVELEDWAGVHICEPTPLSLATGLLKWQDRAVWTEAQRGELARRSADRFDWKQLVAKYREFYAGLLSRA